MILFAVSLWFLYYLLNYADLTRPVSTWLKRQLGPKLGYPLSCAFCWPFWVTLTGYIVYPDWTFWTVLVVPAIHLFIDLTYQRLSGNCPPCVGGDK